MPVMLIVRPSARAAEDVETCLREMMCAPVRRQGGARGC